MHDPTHAPDPHAEGAPHALPARVLLGTFGALLALTVVTVLSARVDLGSFNVVLALAIAAFKATLVGAFFMHLKYERRFQTVVFVGAVLFAALFVAFVVFDTMQYQPGLRELGEALKARKG